MENETEAGLYLFRGSSNQTLIRQTKLSLTETNGKSLTKLSLNETNGKSLTKLSLNETNGKSLQNGPFSSDGPGNKLV